MVWFDLILNQQSKFKLMIYDYDCDSPWLKRLQDCYYRLQTVALTESTAQDLWENAPQGPPKKVAKPQRMANPKGVGGCG